LGDRKGIWHIKKLGHIFTEVLFQSRWRTKTEEKPAYPGSSGVESEQFLNGTSAHYRLFSAISGGNRR